MYILFYYKVELHVSADSCTKCDSEKWRKDGLEIRWTATCRSSDKSESDKIIAAYGCHKPLPLPAQRNSCDVKLFPHIIRFCSISGTACQRVITIRSPYGSARSEKLVQAVTRQLRWWPPIRDENRQAVFVSLVSIWSRLSKTQLIKRATDFVPTTKTLNFTHPAVRSWFTQKCFVNCKSYLATKRRIQGKYKEQRLLGRECVDW